MKKFIVITMGIGLAVLLMSKLKAAPLFTESPIKSVGTPVTVAVSSTTLTKVPTSQTTGRAGVFINSASTWSVVGFLGDCTSTSLASTIRPFEFSKTTISVGPSFNYYLPLRDDICMWLLSLNTTASTQNVHYQEVTK